MSPFSLRIVRVFYLEPSVLAIHARLPLRHDPLKIPLTDLLKQQLAVTFHVLGIDNFRGSDALDKPLPMKNGSEYRARPLAESLSPRGPRPVPYVAGPYGG